MENRPTFNPELLLPAGDEESVTAAVQNGADAVYLGGKLFSARANAANFDETALNDAVRYCHIRGVKVYQTLNTLLFDAEFPALEAAIRAGCAAGVDAFIIQDQGVLALVREMAPAMRIHASTQMTIHTPDGAKMLERMGVCRAVLARELSLAEIRAIAESTSLELEVFIHGALCMSVSGQCYLSAMLGGRSGNRGACAGSCRLPFSPDGREDYALSLKDLCAERQIEALREIGIASLKIEGRMKRPEYVAAAASAYRNILDGKTPDLQTLQAVFSRSGFTSGYLDGKRTPEMFGFRRKDDVTAATPKLLRELANSYQKEHGKIPLSLSFTAHADAPVTLTAADEDGHTVTVLGEIPEAAQNLPSNADGVTRQLEKWGGTPFVLRHCDVTLDDGLYLSASSLNALRRAGCEAIEEARGALSAISVEKSAWQKPEPSRTPFSLTARLERVKQIPFEDLSALSSFSLPIAEVSSHADALLPYREKLVIEPDRVNFSNESAQKEALAALRDRGFSKLLCHHLAQLSWANELGMEAIGSPFLNVTNSRSAASYASLGAKALTLSFESNLRDAKEVTAALPLGVVVYGRLPLMVLRSCPMRRYGDCARCNGERALTDRLGVTFPVRCHERRYSELYNSRPIVLSDRLTEFASFSFGILWFTSEDADTVKRVLREYQSGASPFGEFTRGLYYRSV